MLLIIVIDIAPNTTFANVKIKVNKQRENNFLLAGRLLKYNTRLISNTWHVRAKILPIHLIHLTFSDVQKMLPSLMKHKPLLFPHYLM